MHLTKVFSASQPFQSHSRLSLDIATSQASFLCADEAAKRWCMLCA